MLTKFKKIEYSISESGIGLIEVIAAMGLAVVVITSLVSLSVFTLRSSTKGKLLLEGSKLANEQIELVRAHRDANTWAVFITDIMGCTAGSPCHMCVGNECSPPQAALSLGTGSGYGYVDQGTPTEVRYSFTVTDSAGGAVTVDDDVVRVDVEIRWFTGNDETFSHIYTDVSNWRQL